MDCNETQPFLDADADGELDLIRHMELEAHLRSCPACTRRAETVRARRAVLRDSLPRYTAPPQLVERIRESLRAGDAPRVASAPAFPAFGPFWSAVGLAASLALALIGGYAWGGARSRGDARLTEAVSEHVRSLQAGHLMDVVSTDQHTVKPWFSGKLDFAPPVADLADIGYPLIGGRLEHFSGRDAAAIVFRRRQHVINLFVWPDLDGVVPARSESRSGYSTQAWSKGGLNFMAVSEIPQQELGQFAAAYRGRTE